MAERARQFAALEAELQRSIVLVAVGSPHELAASEARCRELSSALGVDPSPLDDEEKRIFGSVCALYARVGVVLDDARRQAAQRAVAARKETGVLDAYRPASSVGRTLA